VNHRPTCPPINELTTKQLLELALKRVRVSIGSTSIVGKIETDYEAIVLAVKYEKSHWILYTLSMRPDASSYRDYIREVNPEYETCVYFEILESVTKEELLSHPSRLARNFAKLELQCT